MLIYIVHVRRKTVLPSITLFLLLSVLTPSTNTSIGIETAAKTVLTLPLQYYNRSQALLTGSGTGTYTHNPTINVLMTYYECACIASPFVALQNWARNALYGEIW